MPKKEKSGLNWMEEDGESPITNKKIKTNSPKKIWENERAMPSSSPEAAALWRGFFFFFWRGELLEVSSTEEGWQQLSTTVVGSFPCFFFWEKGCSFFAFVVTCVCMCDRPHSCFPQTFQPTQGHLEAVNRGRTQRLCVRDCCQTASQQKHTYSAKLDSSHVFFWGVFWNMETQSCTYTRYSTSRRVVLNKNDGPNQAAVTVNSPPLWSTCTLLNLPQPTTHS